MRKKLRNKESKIHGSKSSSRHDRDPALNVYRDPTSVLDLVRIRIRLVALKMIRFITSPAPALEFEMDPDPGST